MANQTPSVIATGYSERKWKNLLLIFSVVVTTAISARAQQDPVGCQGSGLGIALFVDKPQAHVGDTLSYSALVYNNPFPACKTSGVKAWVVTPDGKTNTITLRRTTLNPGESDNYANVATYVIRAQDIVGGIVKGAAADVAKVHQNETLSDGQASQTVNTMVVTPCIDISATCNGGVGQDGQIAFSGTVRNCGDINLAGVTVTNVVDGVARLIFGPVSLAAGQSTNFSGRYKPANPCSPSTVTFITAGVDQLKQPRAVTANTSTTCGISLTPGISIVQSCPTTPATIGGQFTYGGAITNTGDVTLTNVVVVSDQPAAGTVIYSSPALAPKAVANFTGKFTAPANVCSVTVSLRVTAASSCGQAVSANSSSTCPLQGRPAIIVTQNCPANPVAPGEVLAFTGTVKNTGDISLRGIEVVGSNPNAKVFVIESLDPGAVASFTGSFTTPVDACSVTNTLVASARDVCANQAVSNTVITVCTLATSPAIAISEECPATPPPLGGTLTYSATLRNTGNVTLLNVSVVSERPGNSVVFQAPRLAPGAVTNFIASYTVPANYAGCSITNTLRAVGSDKCSGRSVSASVSAICLVKASPKIRIVANCPAAATAPGGRLIYTGTISNTGDVELKNISVVADKPETGTVVHTLNSLAPGASASFTGSYTAPLDACSTSVRLAVTAVDSCANTSVSDSVIQTCPLTSTPAVAVTVECPSTPTAPGKQLVFTGKISNTGNITVTNVTVVVNRPSANSPVFGPVTLAPGASMNYTGSFTVPLDINGCSIASTITVRGNGQCNGALATASANANCPVATTPAILVTADCPGTATPQGGLLTYKGTVKNTGNIALTNVVVVNNRPTNGTPVFRIAILLPNQSTNFTGSYLVPGNCCEVVSTLTATGSDYCSARQVVDTATIICPVKYTPAVRISRVCPSQVLKPGDELPFTGYVTNNGNVTLTGVTVVSALAGPNKLILGPVDLGPGEILPYSSSVTIPADFCGTDILTVTGQSICGESVRDVITTTCPIQTTPGIAVMNLPAVATGGGSGTGCTANSGRGTVANTGNVTLSDVWVYCNQPANNTPVFGPITLAPGATTNFTYTFTTPSQCNCCSLSVTLTASGKGKCDGKQVAHSSTLVLPVLTTPKLSVTLDCSNTATDGWVLGVVQNAGDIALSNVVVTSSLPAEGTLVLPSMNLAPGESQTFLVAPQTTDPGALKSLTVVATGRNICGGAEVRAASTCFGPKAAPIVITHRSNQDIILTWAATAGVKYRVQYKNTLAENAWQSLDGDVTPLDFDGMATKTDANRSGTTKFYRILILE